MTTGSSHSVPCQTPYRYSLQECTGDESGEIKSKQLCFIAFLPDILDSKASGRNAYIKTLTKLADKFKDRPFSWLWAGKAVKPRGVDMEVLTGKGLTPPDLTVRRCRSAGQSGAELWCRWFRLPCIGCFQAQGPKVRNTQGRLRAVAPSGVHREAEEGRRICWGASRLPSQHCHCRTLGRC